MSQSKTIRVRAGSELDHILQEADEETVILERDGARYQIARLDNEDLWKSYDPNAASTAIRSVAGTLSDEEARRFKDLIYRGREEGTRSPDRRGSFIS